MMILTLLTLVIWPSVAPAKSAALMSCTAVYRTLDEHNNTVEHTAEVPVKATLGEQVVRHEAVFEGRTFLLTEDHGDLFAQIIAQNPDYAKGATARGAPDHLGRFTAAEVAGFTVYRLECVRAN